MKVPKHFFLKALNKRPSLPALCGNTETAGEKKMTERGQGSSLSRWSIIIRADSRSKYEVTRARHLSTTEHDIARFKSHFRFDLNTIITKYQEIMQMIG
ncbi:hypothetical protein TNCV_2890851 [Trichonephila clavipes]|nr:hypothetical protein TNCV_2890851 [Trichonephila clavipes]